MFGRAFSRVAAPLAQGWRGAKHRRFWAAAAGAGSSAVCALAWSHESTDTVHAEQHFEQPSLSTKLQQHQQQQQRFNAEQAERLASGGGDTDAHSSHSEKHNRHFSHSTNIDLNPRLFSGNANYPLAKEIANCLESSLGSATVATFPDGEIRVQIHENIRGKDVYIIQPTCPPGVNDNLMELIIMISTMRRASARKITAVIPYYGYARQDRKMNSRVPISAADVAVLLQAVGVDRVVAVDLHCGQIQGFFHPRNPCDNLDGGVVALNYFRQMEGLQNVVIVSPDAGGVYRAKKFRDGFSSIGINASLAMMIKQRTQASSIESMDLVGSVDGCDVIIVDDMIDTAGTLCKCADQLKLHGARRVFAFATHGLFSGGALLRIQNSALEKVVVTNSIPLPENKRIEKIEQLSIAELLAEAILRIHHKESVSGLFNVN